MKFYYITSFTLPKSLKDLDPSYHTDLDFWDCFGRKCLSYSEEIQYLQMQRSRLPLIFVNNIQFLLPVGSQNDPLPYLS